MVMIIEFPTMPRLKNLDWDSWLGVNKLHEVWMVFTNRSKLDVGTGAGVYIKKAGIMISFRLP